MFPAPRDARRAGVIMHPTSLPGNYGIGDMGTEVGGLWAHTLSHTQIQTKITNTKQTAFHKLPAGRRRG